MAYDERLAARVRTLLKGRRTLAEKKMFGGLAFMSRGKMFAGVLKTDLVVRVGSEMYDTALKASRARPMNFTGRPIKGFVYVSPGGIKSAATLRKWLTKGLDFAASLPPVKRKVLR